MLWASAKALLCAGVLAAVAALLWGVLEGAAEGGFVQVSAVLLLTLVVSGAAYVVAARLLRLEELAQLWRLLARRVSRRSGSTPPASDPEA